jgi:hypothetical protein
MQKRRVTMQSAKRTALPPMLPLRGGRRRARLPHARVDAAVRCQGQGWGIQMSQSFTTHGKTERVLL